jgi:hypothetical protein
MLVFVSSALYGFVLAAEYFGWIPHVDMPFVTNRLSVNATYVLFGTSGRSRCTAGLRPSASS